MASVLERLQTNIRNLCDLVKYYYPDFVPQAVNGFPTELRGYSQSSLSLAVYKQTVPVEFAAEQATFMLFLGDKVCPKILGIDDTGYVMEYMRPAHIFVGSLIAQEVFLRELVWERSLEDIPYTKMIGDESWRDELERTLLVDIPEWALDTPCLVHGDPSLDNTLETKDGHIRITDPIPPHRLVRPSIRAIDHSKILQSFLGWEVVLRGTPRVLYDWPKFMQDYDSARRAVFWTMVALKRIALRNNQTSAGRWAERVGVELLRCL